MHHYPFHVGDYLLKTAHLPPMADLAYRRLLDLYYMEEGPIPNKPKWVANRIRLESEEPIIGFVLREFFELRGTGTAGFWHNSRADKVIAKYQKKAAVARENGALHVAGTKKGPKSVADRTITKTRTSTPPKGGEATGAGAPTSRGSRLPQDWKPTEADVAFIREKRPDLNPSTVADLFRDHWTAQSGKAGVKLDWSATWRNWVRNQRALPASAGSTGTSTDWWATRSGVVDRGAQLGLDAPGDEASAWFPFMAQVWVAAGDGPWWDKTSVAYPLAVRMRDEGNAVASAALGGLRRVA